MSLTNHHSRVRSEWGCYNLPRLMMSQPFISGDQWRETLRREDSPFRILTGDKLVMFHVVIVNLAGLIESYSNWKKKRGGSSHKKVVRIYQNGKYRRVFTYQAYALPNPSLFCYLISNTDFSGNLTKQGIPVSGFGMAQSPLLSFPPGFSIWMCSNVPLVVHRFSHVCCFISSLFWVNYDSLTPGYLG